MHQKEIDDLSLNHPLLTVVINKILDGGKIESDDPLYQDYLLARQRGFVTRDKIDGDKIVISDRGREFLSRR